MLPVPPAFCAPLPGEADTKTSVLGSRRGIIRHDFVPLPVCVGTLLASFSPPLPSAVLLIFEELPPVPFFPLPPFVSDVLLPVPFAVLVPPP